MEIKKDGFLDRNKNQKGLSQMMESVAFNHLGMIVLMIESVQKFIIKKNLGKKKDGTGSIFISLKIIIL